MSFIVKNQLLQNFIEKNKNKMAPNSTKRGRFIYEGCPNLCYRVSTLKESI
jgi:hypothetical protein